MGFRAHVQTKHEIEYGGTYFNWKEDLIGSWLRENGVEIDDEDSYEWELDKEQLREIPERAFHDICEDGDKIRARELRKFVDELLGANTGDYAYVDWW